nr:immunoglobulin light chain junction region [Macaca mulatta]
DYYCYSTDSGRNHLF